MTVPFVTVRWPRQERAAKPALKPCDQVMRNAGGPFLQSVRHTGSARAASRAAACCDGSASEKSNPGGSISVPVVLQDTRSGNMRSHLYGAIAIAAMIATPAMAQTTTRTSNTMSTPAPGAGASTPTLSHDGSNSLTDSSASSASNSPGAGASPHTGYSSGMTPSAGTGSGTADGTTDTGATSPGSGKSAARR